MRRKDGLITVILCVILIWAGKTGFSLWYEKMFQPELLITEEDLEDEEWTQEMEKQAREILYPFLAWKESGSIRERNDSNVYKDFYHCYPDRYQAVLDLVGLSEYLEILVQNEKVRTYYFEPETTEFEKYELTYMVHITQIKSQTDELIILLNNNLMPVLCQYHAKKAEEIQAADILQSVLIAEEIPQRCYEDLARLDTAFGNKRDYQLFRILAGEEIAQQDSSIALLEKFLYCCKEYGEWRCYADGENEAYVCTLSSYHIIVYYDKESRQFCGYSFAQNEIK